MRRQWNRFRCWLRYRFLKCDGCSGRFGMERLNAVSGDAWLCDDCICAYLMDAREQAKKGRAMYGIKESPDAR